jgi:circadian clock protein KaiC
MDIKVDTFNKEGFNLKANVPSGISGLDELLQGGFPKDRTILVYGGPGSGKTTLCVQYLYNGAVHYDEPGILVTLNETPDEIKDNMSSFSWDLDKLETTGLLTILDIRAVRVNKAGFISLSQNVVKDDAIPFSHLARRISETAQKMKAKRLVLDSLTALTFQSNQPEVIIRYGVLGLFQILTQLECTSLMISESRFTQRSQPQSVIPLELFLATGVINLYTDVELEGVRAIQIQKMRGINHDSAIRPFAITQNGISIDSQGKVRVLR